MLNCSQCGKPAVVTVGEHPLCVDCNFKLQQSVNLRNERLERQMNFLTDHVEATVGLPGILPRFPKRQTMVHQGPVTLNNIKVDNSVVGTINTGYVQSIDVSMSHFKASGHDQLAEEITKFTESVIKEVSLTNDLKNGILEKISFLTTELFVAKEKQRKSIVKSILSSIKEGISSVASLCTLWDKILPLLQKLFF